MSLIIDRATKEDVNELLSLYFSTYGASYPLPLGTDRGIMSKMISSDDNMWLVTRDTEKNIIVGSVVFEIDWLNKIGKVVGVVVHPQYRRSDIAYNMISQGTNKKFLSGDRSLNSIYTTTRTVSVGPQLMFLKDGFLPLGIFQNAHKLKQYETLTLLAKFKPGVLERRAPFQTIPEKLTPILQVMNDILEIKDRPEILGSKRREPADEELEFEIIFAHNYVKKRFYETFTDSDERFYPFHIPNLLAASTNGEVDLYAYFSKVDRYCPLVAANVPFYTPSGRMAGLLDQLEDYGAESYTETLTKLNDIASIEVLLNEDFLPSAVYPAMLEIDEKMYDFVVMSRTMEPFNFKGMKIERAFKPYLEQYVNLWKQMHLDSLEVLMIWGQNKVGFLGY